MLDKDLVDAINDGHCVALIGSGPSCEAGLPSWAQLVEKVTEKVVDSLSGAQLERVRKLCETGEYAGALGVIEEAIGRRALCAQVRLAIIPPGGQSSVYSILARWPFAFYMTTNFDSLMKYHLNSLGLYTPELNNSPEDLSTINVQTRDVIVKLHGDLSDPERTILTAKDYQSLTTQPQWKAYRDKLVDILSMFRVLIIGHSLRDPDLQMILRHAKKVSSPSNPVYMLLADTSPEEVRKHYVEFNIKIDSYPNPDGSHRYLRSALKAYDAFIVKRRIYCPRGGTGQSIPDDPETASSLHLYTHLTLGGQGCEFVARAYASTILDGLLRTSGMCGRVSDAVRQSPLGPEIAKQVIANASELERAADLLQAEGLTESLPDGQVRVTQSGLERLCILKRQREILEQQFLGQVYLRLKTLNSNLDDDRARHLASLIRRCLIDVFSKRGLDLARSLFATNCFELEGNTAVLEALNASSEVLASRDEQTAFVRAASDLLLQPTAQEREYLCAVSQGYFAFHALGLDPICKNLRLNLARKTVWFIDSSILIPLLAEGCVGHEAAKYIHTKARELGLRLCTTERLAAEAASHAKWAITHFGRSDVQSVSFKLASSGEGGYRQNLFLNGFVSWAQGQGAPTLTGYVKEMCGGDPNRISQRLDALGIETVAFGQWPGFDQALHHHKEKVAAEIARIRQERATYRSEEQCLNEAEVVILVECIRNQTASLSRDYDDAYFISQSGALNIVYGKPRAAITWRPEAFLRFIAMLLGEGNSVSLHQVMLQDFYLAGIPVVDSASYTRFFSPLIQSAKMSLRAELDRYRQRLGEEAAASFEDEVARVQELSLPETVLSLVRRLHDEETRALQEARRRASAAEQRARLTEKERKELERLRAKAQAKQQRHKRRRRRAESSRRKRKKR